ncbi:YceI family protein, partial [Nitrospinae bacterium AH_259_B05_G02_I21]|nr:YceI family protein [Nitrospinae bacterium AH_259_B05_G02_I21]
EELEEIREKMMGAEQLDAESFPTVSFRTERVRQRGEDELRLEGPLTLHGVTRPVEVTAKLSREADGIRVTGELEIKQRDYDIEPVSIGGVVKVANELDIRFAIFLRPA